MEQNSSGDQINANIAGDVSGQVAVGSGIEQTQGGSTPVHQEDKSSRIAAFFDSTTKIVVAATGCVIAIGALLGAIIALVH
jgi:hypothetical protein